MKPNIELARIVATFMHTKQTYGDGKPYTTHLKAVVDTLTEFDVTDEDLLMAGWLHDIVEDTPAKLSDIAEIFGDRVAKLVFAVTNELNYDAEDNRAKRNAKTYRKMLEYPTAIQLKLADRIANVRHGLTNSQTTRFFKMYQKEYTSFRETLFTENEYCKMWKCLDSLMEFSA